MRLIQLLASAVFRFTPPRLRYGILNRLRSLGNFTLRSHYGMRLRYRNDLTFQFALRGTYGELIPGAIRTLKRGDIFVDVGSNIGVWSLYASSVVGPSGLVFAFEPQADIVLDFAENCRVNQALNVRCFSAAISDREGLARLSTVRGHSGLAHLSEQGELAAPLLHGDHVAGLVLAALSPDISCGVKIDVEGHELHVVRPMRRLLADRRTKFVIVECDEPYLNRFGASADELYGALIELGLSPTQAPHGWNPSLGHYDEIFVRTW